ncbi:MAG: hypothetical protein ACP5NZ_01250 [Nanobdellota archaeon]
MENWNLSNESKKTALNDKEIEIVSLFAAIRRESSALKHYALVLSQEENSDLEENKKILEKIKKESDGINTFSQKEAEDELSKYENKYLSDVELFQELDPNHSAYLLGYIAKLKQFSGKPFQEELEKTKKLTKQKNQEDITLSNLLAHAQILGIEKRQVAEEELPSIEVLAKIATENENSVRDIGLVLNEKNREQFLSLIPEEKRKKISILMDNEISKVLSQRIIEKSDDKEQAILIKDREEIELEKAINNPEEYNLPLIKYISQSLSALDSEDSKRLLIEIGATGLAGEKDKKKQEMKISFIARIVKIVIDIDIAKGSNLAVKFLAKKELPDKLFSFFTSRLIKEGYFTKNTNHYLTDKENMSFLRRLIATYPNQFNTVLDTISQIKDYSPGKNQEEVFSAISDLESLTPIIFDRYRKADVFGKKELAQQIRELKPKFFRNIPVKNILEKKDQDILIEMVYLAYKPVGMNFEKVKGLMSKIEDRTEDLENFSFPEAGYNFSLGVGQKILLKEGESLDWNKLPIFKKILVTPYPEDEESIKKFSSLLGRIAKAGTLNEEETGIILSVMNRDEFIVNSTKKFNKINDENVYNYLNEMREIFGIYFKDNYKERLQNFLSANPSIEGQIMKTLTNPERQKTLKIKLGKRAEEINWNNLTEKKELARLIAIFLDNSILKASKDTINKNINKFTTEDGRARVATNKNLKAYISKNVGSFFAKASAGICTAEDIPLFNTKNHFHINVVEGDDSVRANIQAYIIDDNGKKSLLLRGFNPNTDFLDKIDTPSFVEKVIEISKQFQKENNLNEVYITEQGSWHSLSNREKVASYLMKRYHNRKNEVLYSFKVATNNTISYIYKV